MSFHDSRRSLSVDEWQAPVDTAEPDVGETANAGGEEYTERFSQSVKDRLTYAPYAAHASKWIVDISISCGKMVTFHAPQSE